MDSLNPLNAAQHGAVPEAAETATPQPTQEPQATQQPGQPAFGRLTGRQSVSAPRPVSPPSDGSPSVLARLAGQVPVSASPHSPVRSADSSGTRDNPPDAKEQLVGLGFTSAQIEAMSRRSEDTLTKAVKVWPTINERNKLAGNTHELVARVASQEGSSGLDALYSLALHPMHQFYLAERVKELGIDGPENTGWADWQQTNRPV